MTSTDRRGYLREYQREWLAARRAAWFAANGPCVRCGSWDDLELDHIDPAEKVHHSMWSWAKARREAELAKCQVLCHECHLGKTAGEWHGRWGSNTQPHVGTDVPGTTGYRRGCRCLGCCRAESAYKVAYRATTAEPVARPLATHREPAPKASAWVAQALRRRAVPHSDPIDLETGRQTSL